MFCSTVVCTAAALLAGIQVSPALAQQGVLEPRALGARPVATAARVAAAPIVDGLLDDRAWEDAPRLTGFVQAEPFGGQPASQSTEVRIVYDDDALYISAMLYDSDPSQIVTTDTRRDSRLNAMDSFQLILDTYHDQQNGFVFGTNAAGVQYDAQVRNQGGASSSWDGSWDVATRITEMGWSAEFRIPLRTLRYGPAPQTWGVNFFRNIQRTRERTYWAPLEREYNLGRLSSAGELRNLNLQTPRNFKVLPYAVSSANRNFSPGATADLDGDIGFDAKFGITPSLNLDATYNTDFAQVEVDTQQINLTRFNLRFPEKRPFFLENAGLFQVGKGREVDLFFSRRIGIGGRRRSRTDPGRRPVERQGRRGPTSGRSTCRRGRSGGQSGNNVSVLRASRELQNRSGFGAIFVNRTGDGPALRGQRLEPDLGRGRSARHRRALHDVGIRGANGDAGALGARLRVQHRHELERRTAPGAVRVGRDGRGLQSRGGIPAEKRRLPPHALPVRGVHEAGQDPGLGFP